MLPDDSTGQSPGTLARKLSRCKEGIARLPSPKVGCFCRHGTNIIACWRGRGTRLLAGRLVVSAAEIREMGTGAVSRYNLSRSQNFVMVQNLNCVQMSVSGFSSHNEFVKGAGAKAKTVTNNLPLLSVLWAVILKGSFLFQKSY